MLDGGDLYQEAPAKRQSRERLRQVNQKGNYARDHLSLSKIGARIFQGNDYY